MEIKHRPNFYFIGALVFILIFTGFFLLFEFGYIGPNSGKTGRLVLSGIDENTKVFIDNERQSIKLTKNGGLVKTYPGEKDIIVSKENYWPWLKKVNVNKEGLTEITPLLVPQIINPEVIEASDPEYEKIMELIQTNYPASAPKITLSSDKKVSVWVQDEKVRVSWLPESNPPPYFCIEKCSSTIEVFKPQEPLRNVDFFSSRNDVLILAIGKSIYALETDLRGTQNFVPIYIGATPKFIKLSENKIYIEDAGTLLALPI